MRLVLCALASCLIAGAFGCGNGDDSPPMQNEVDSGVPGEIGKFDDLESSVRSVLSSLSPSQDLPAPPPDPSNQFADDDAAARLGQSLFFDAGFSGKLLDADNDGSSFAVGTRGETRRVSCASCHNPRAGFLDNRSPGGQVSLGSGWGLRRARSLLDVGHARLLMWDGSRDALWNQIFGPLESPIEMNGSRLFAAQEMFRRYRTEYEAIFGPMPPLDDDERFPPLAAEDNGCQEASITQGPTCNGPRHGMPGDGAEFDSMTPEDQDLVTEVVVNMGKAIAAYERRLSCGASRFDAWVHGDEDALMSEEKRGAVLFAGKAGCVGCHSGPMLSDERFHNVGLRPQSVAFGILDADDRGAAVGIAEAIESPLNVRGQFSDGDDGRLPEEVTAGMEGAFKTCTLRCSGRRLSFMHTGQLTSLVQVVDFFDRGGDPSGYPGHSELSPIGLTAEEKADLVAFLRALDGPGPAQELIGAPP